MRIAVTGAAGFLGSAIVRRLTQLGHNVVAITRTGNAPEVAVEQRAVGDLLDVDPAIIVAGCDTVVNCAARVHEVGEGTGPAAAEAHNRMNHQFAAALGAAARTAGCHRLVQISTVAAITSRTAPGIIIDDHVPAHPQSHYGKAKLAADEALASLANAEFAVVSLRPPAIIGEGAAGWFNLLNRAARLGVPMPLGAFENRRSFSFVTNIADAAAASALGGPGGTYIVTDSRPLSTAALYRRLLAFHGHGDRVWNVPTALVAPLVRVVLKSRADSLLGNAHYDGHRFAKAFSWQPPVQFDDALAEMIARSRSDAT